MFPSITVPDDFSPSTLAYLSRNASVISTSSSDSSPSMLTTPRQRPPREFASPRSKSPHSPTQRPPSYLTKELGMVSTSPDAKLQPNAKPRSKSRGRSISIADFQVGNTLGEGSYSTVMRATYISTGKEFAIKVLDKGHLLKKRKMSVALVEKQALVRLAAGHPGLIRLHYTFQDEWSLYFVLDLAPNGEIQSLISRLGSLTVPCAQLYGAQIVDAVDYMHGKGVIHRDLKPENLLLDEHNRIKIADFGTAKLLESDMEVEKFVGTAQYVAPELVESNETSKSSDLWAIGCIIYQMIAGKFAFSGLSEFLTLQKIKKMEYSFPEGFDENAKDLVEKLLVRVPLQRLGAGDIDSDNGMDALRAHAFFDGVQWDALWTTPVPPLEAGLVKKPPPPTSMRAWGDSEGYIDRDDGVDWESEDELVRDVSRMRMDHAAIGPLGEVRPFSGSSSTAPSRGPESVPSASSSSEDSITKPPDKLPPTQPKDSTLRIKGTVDHGELERGRAKEMTPVQGNGSTPDLSLALKLGEDEGILFRSDVAARTLRRRASKLLPIPVPVKPKARELILTTQRLICVKHSGKSSGDISIKLDLPLRADKQKDRDSSDLVVELRGDREFSVLNSSKSYSYAVRDSKLASLWVQNIDSAILTLGNDLDKRT